MYVYIYKIYHDIILYTNMAHYDYSIVQRYCLSWRSSQSAWAKPQLRTETRTKGNLILSLDSHCQSSIDMLLMLDHLLAHCLLDFSWICWFFEGGFRKCNWKVKMFYTQKKSSGEVPKRSGLLMCVFCACWRILPSCKLTLQWKITMFNREYIFKRLIFYCHASLQRGVSC